MSGNIFASSTVPGIQDREREKQAIARWGQSYHLSRTDFTAAYWVKLMIGSTLLMIVVPIFLARLFLSAIQQPQVDSTVLLSRLFPPALQPSRKADTDEFQLAEIPISAVLTQALAKSNDTRSRGLLTHALLELQNPEITSFAGPGYGVHLKEMNRGAQLEAFPEGKLPWCGVRGRYDEWGRIRGLRYAYQSIITVGDASLTRNAEDDSRAGELDWESLLMGWPALLLERARVDDPLNPVPPGSRRNVYGEAVDRVVKKLCADGCCDWDPLIGGSGEVGNTNEDVTVMREDAQQVTSSNEHEDPELFGKTTTDQAASAFITPSFLAIYAVARQDPKWLMGAVSQLRAQLHAPTVNLDKESYIYRTAETVESASAEVVLGLQDESKEQPNEKPWAWMGTVRVLSVLQRWNPALNPATDEDRLRYEKWKSTAMTDLEGQINRILPEMREKNRERMGVLEFCTDITKPETCTWGSNPAMTALLVGTIYRLAQLKMLDDLALLEWADELYNAVAVHVTPDGNMNLILQVQEDGNQVSGRNAGEGQSMVIMMWTARRDCTKTGICRRYERPSWWHQLKGVLVGSRAPVIRQ